MKPAQRDELLFRLDETVKNIWNAVEKLEGHQETQNGHILESFTRSATAEAKSDKNYLWIKIVSGVGGAAILIFAAVLVAILT